MRVAWPIKSSADRCRRISFEGLRFMDGKANKCNYPTILCGWQMGKNEMSTIS